MKAMMRSEAEALTLIRDVLEEIIKRPIMLKGDEDLLASGILDSLDGLRFFFGIEERTGIHLPSEDLAQQGFYKTDRLIAYLLERA